MKNSRSIVFIIIVIIGFVFCSCLDDDNYYYVRNAASVYIVNTSPDAPGLLFYADRNRINNASLTYADAEGYYFLYTGNREISIRDAVTGNTLTTKSILMSSNRYYGLFAVDSVENLNVLVINENFDMPRSGTSHVRFMNLSPGSVTIHAIIGKKDTLKNLNFKEYTDFFTFNEGIYNIVVLDSVSNTMLTQLRGQTFNSRGIYSLFLKGYTSPPAGNTNNLAIEVITH